MVSSIRPDRGRKGTIHILCGQQDADKFTTRRGTNLGIFTHKSTWKQDARKRFELRSADK